MVAGLKGAIFDLDGTLVDSMGVWEKIDRDFLEKKGISIPDDLAIAVKSMGFQEAAVYFKERFGFGETVDEIIDEWQRMAFDEYAGNIKLKPGVKQYLARIKSEGMKIGLATITYRKLAEAALKRNGILHFFDAFSTGDEFFKGKECPDIYLATAAKLGLTPEECIVFEDILAGVLSARKVGMTVIAVFDRYSSHEREQMEKLASRYITGFEELLAR